MWGLPERETPEPNFIDPVTGYSLTIPLSEQGRNIPPDIVERIERMRAELGIGA